MISGLSSTGAHINVSGGSPGTLYIDNNRPLAGSVKYDGVFNSLMIFDGSTWQQMPHSYTTVGLTSVAEDAIVWATKKMLEEKMHKEMAEKHRAVQIALDNVEKAKQQLDVTIILSREHDKQS